MFWVELENSRNVTGAEMQEELEQATAIMVEMVTVYGIDVIAAIVILIAGWWISGRIRIWVNKGLSMSGRIDQMVVGFAANTSRYLALTVTVLAVLDRFGVETTSFIAILGAMGLAVGLALQGTLSNVAAGVMLLFFRPFKVGDFIEGGGQSGTVAEVSLFVTHLKTPDNVQIIVPNNQLWNAAIKNFSHNPTRRLDLMFGIGYEDDIDQAIEIINKIITGEARAHSDPEPLVVVGELGDSSVNLIVRIWCEGGDYWSLKWDMLKTVKQTFDLNGISIPYPQTDVHLYQQDT